MLPERLSDRNTALQCLVSDCLYPNFKPAALFSDLLSWWPIIIPMSNEMKRQYSCLTEQGSECDQNTSKLVSVKKSNIPAFLHNSEFYLSLLNDKEECMKKNDTVDNNEDLHSLLLTLRFWVADSVCNAVLAYALTRPFEAYEDILSEFDQDFPALMHIKSLTASSDPINVAIESGFISFVKYFLQLGHLWPENACAVAIEAGHTAMLKFAIESGCVVSTLAATVASAKGHLAWLKFLHEKGAIWSTSVTSAAARGGHLDCLQYARENGCPWLCHEMHPDDIDFEGEFVENGGCDEDEENNICTIAAGNGRLNCLQYAHNQGCRCNQEHWRLQHGVAKVWIVLSMCTSRDCPWTWNSLMILCRTTI